MIINEIFRSRLLAKRERGRKNLIDNHSSMPSIEPQVSMELRPPPSRRCSREAMRIAALANTQLDRTTVYGSKSMTLPSISRGRSVTEKTYHMIPLSKPMGIPASIMKSNIERWSTPTPNRSRFDVPDGSPPRRAAKSFSTSNL